MLEDMAERFLYYPDRIPPDMPPPPWAGDAAEVFMTAEDGVEIHGLWWDEPAGSQAVLFLHGNAQEVYSWSLVREDLEALERRMLLIDYHGYGKSGGTPGEESLYRDGRAAMRFLEEAGVPEGEVVVFGKSLGGAVACDIAAERDIAALVLESTFTSLRSVARKLFPFAGDYVPAGSAYDSLEKIARAHCPVLVIHGDRDNLIPFNEGELLFEAAAEPREFYAVRGAGHNDVSMVAGPEYARRIRAFLDGL